MIAVAKITEVNLSSFAYRLFSEDFSFFSMTVYFKCPNQYITPDSGLGNGSAFKVHMQYEGKGESVAGYTKYNMYSLNQRGHNFFHDG